MRNFRIGAFLVLTILVGVVAIVAYNLGVSAGAADAAVAAGASVIYAPAAISPFGIIIGGFFLLLILGFLAKVIAGPRHRMGHAGWGRSHHRDWDPEDVPEQFRPMLERWHQETHATPAGAKAGTGPAPSAAGTPPPSWRPPATPPPSSPPPTGA